MVNYLEEGFGGASSAAADIDPCARQQGVRGQIEKKIPNDKCKCGAHR